MTDEGGVLGNLPNSRPGRRSAKRERPAKAAEKAAVKAEASGTAAAKPAAASRTKPAQAKRTKRTSAKPGRAAAGKASPHGRTTAVKEQGSGDGVDVMHDMDAKRRHDPASSSGDPLSAAVRGAAGLAVTGVKVGGAVTKEILRRLARP
jgi:hypothetical protein